MIATVVELQGLATLQGLPTPGYRRFGVPTGGAFDQESLFLLNLLLGNSHATPALELSNATAQIHFASEALIAVTGAPGGLANRSFRVTAGQRIMLEAPRLGARVYLGVEGGWQNNASDRLGLLQVHERDALAYVSQPLSRPIVRLADLPTSLEPTIRLLPGVHSPELRLDRLRVSSNSDRTGIRLEGNPPSRLPEQRSEPTCLGAVQLTPSGQLILLGPDGPTIGGYPNVGVVCSADLDRLSQLRLGQEVHLEQIDFARALELGRERESRMQQLSRQIEFALHGLDGKEA